MCLTWHGFSVFMRCSPIALLLACAFPFPALAAPRDLAIAAEVGADAISSYDVANRIKFIITTARLSNSPDVIEKIRPQVIRSLIDEKLQLQEAEKNDIKVSDQDVEQAIAAIEDQRNMPHGTINSIMDSSNVPRETFRQQIRAQLSWNRLLNRKVRPHVRVSDDEIRLASQKFTPSPKKKTTGPQEFKIAAITLPVEKKAADAEMRRLGEKLVKEVRGGASFEEVSRQFSSVAASAGGKVETFWIRLGQLDPKVASALSGASAGMITDPVRTNEGYTIIKVYDTRGAVASEAEAKPKDVEVNMKEILLKLKPDAGAKEADVMLQIGEEVARNPGTCDEKGIANIGNLDDFDIEVNFREQALSELPPAIKIIAENLKIGDISTPFASYEGIRLYMLCGKKETDAKPVKRDEVHQMLMQQKMELEAQKYIRNLRREVFIDIR
jgi:peptidyl-prolyl cis-trans isomerase SurA